MKGYLEIDKLRKMSKEQREKKLARYRKRVDLLDKIIVFLLNLRTRYSINIGRIKISLGIPTYVPERERDIMEKITKKNKGPLSKESLQRIYERILDQSRATQKRESENIL
jgi:chorismate mutase